jgi:hypothetical protein
MNHLHTVQMGLDVVLQRKNLTPEDAEVLLIVEEAVQKAIDVAREIASKDEGAA